LAARRETTYRPESLLQNLEISVSDRLAAQLCEQLGARSNRQTVPTLRKRDLPDETVLEKHGYDVCWSKIGADEKPAGRL
jgi:hypothetical protein